MIFDWKYLERKRVVRLMSHKFTEEIYRSVFLHSLILKRRKLISINTICREWKWNDKIFERKKNLSSLFLCVCVHVRQSIKSQNTKERTRNEKLLPITQSSVNYLMRKQCDAACRELKKPSKRASFFWCLNFITTFLHW